MKGWPLRRACITLLVLLLVGLPLRSLTRPRIEPVQTVSVTPATEKLTIALTFSQPPQSYAVKFLGRDILTGSAEASFEASTTLQAEFPEEGIDFIIEGTWPEYIRKVGVNVQLIRANGTRQSQQIWGKRKLFELVSFSGKNDGLEKK